ncbi:MAG: hypothetical protein KJO28_06600 [Desulfofustis sp.]|nr:hypothetical protein [Desulfofustis sp.]NNF47056.1 hypothetical protein [Desulfofustis sp.]NNK56569.1 hypothetical protein [Desulfofustis sp.]
MREGDLVIADDPESGSGVLSRIYGIILEITGGDSVLIQLSDGSVIRRKRNSVAVYIQPPSNWQDLFKQQEVPFESPKQALFTTTLKNRSSP